MENLEKWRKDFNVSLSSIGILLNSSKGRISNIEKGYRAINKKEREKFEILDKYAANFSNMRKTVSMPIIVKDTKLEFKLAADKIKLRKVVMLIEKLDKKIEPLEMYLQYLSYLKEEPSISDTLEYEYVHRSTKDKLEKNLLKRQYLLIKKAALSAEIAVNEKFNTNEE